MQAEKLANKYGNTAGRWCQVYHTAHNLIDWRDLLNYVRILKGETMNTFTIEGRTLNAINTHAAKKDIRYYLNGLHIKSDDNGLNCKRKLKKEDYDMKAWEFYILMGRWPNYPVDDYSRMMVNKVLGK